MMPATRSSLPDLGRLLDPAQLLSLLSPVTDTRAVLAAVEPFYLRWKPGTSALLGVRLTWRLETGEEETLASLYLGEGRFEAAEKARSQRLLEPPFGPAIQELGDALFIAFPNDRRLKGLNAVADERRVGNRLAQPGSPFGMRALRVRTRDSSVRPVRWKPGRRAVLELHLRLVDDASGYREQWRAFARVIPHGELEDRVERWRAAAGLCVLGAPDVVFVDPERGWFATSPASGRPLSTVPGERLLASLVSVFSALHAARSPALGTRPDTVERDAALHALEALAQVAPELEARVHTLGARLADAHAALAPYVEVFTHGDLGAEQLLVQDARVSVIDWDEAANGDPHFDHASLAADVRGRGLDASWVGSLARAVLGERFDAARFAWQCAAAEARRVTQDLQRGRADWRTRALDGLDAVERALAAAARVSVGSPRGSGMWLSALLDPARRGSVPGSGGAGVRLTAAWPEGEGAIVRLEHGNGDPSCVRWLRVNGSVEVFDFPSDPALPQLSGLVATGRFRIAGHRFGRRAALSEPGVDRFLFVRTARALEKSYANVCEAHRRLTRAGVTSSRPLGLASEALGWWAVALHGHPLDLTEHESSTWRELGATLARAHAALRGESAPLGALAAAVAAGRRQVTLMRLADPAFAARLDRDLDQVPRHLSSGHAAYVHGDFHPGQVLVGRDIAVLDWERARVGEAEEDLGNLCAHLAWGPRALAAIAWQAFLHGYHLAGGGYDTALLIAHTRASLARLRAVHGWRDGTRELARNGTRWERWFDEVFP
jgi:aminoglycoside phosphotransferase (APT) family kinase protein